MKQIQVKIDKILNLFTDYAKRGRTSMVADDFLEKGLFKILVDDLECEHKVLGMSLYGKYYCKNCKKIIKPKTKIEKLELEFDYKLDAYKINEMIHHDSRIDLLADKINEIINHLNKE